MEPLSLRLAWRSAEAEHEERHYYPVGVMVDGLPPDLAETVRSGGEAEAILAPGALPAPCGPELVRELPLERFQRDWAGLSLTPREGRFYPRQILLPSGQRDDLPRAPLFRAMETDEAAGRLTADFSHPLCPYELRLSARSPGAASEFETPIRYEEEAVEWGFGAPRPPQSFPLAATLLKGPGMQARRDGRPTRFFEPDGFAREDESPDARFYEKPRPVSHVDPTASKVLAELHAELLPAGGRVLDLMAGHASHLPPEAALAEVVGLGLNEAEMDTNMALTGRVRHDVNADPRLPFEDASFDAAICALSVDYMSRPVEVFQDAARVLKPGGLFVVSFSNRWFPPKVIRLWTMLTEFERLGLVLHYFLESGRFAGLATRSVRGLPRPAADQHRPELPHADPVFAAWGRKA